MPAYGAINAPSTLADVPQIFNYLDQRYGPPDKDEKDLKKENGEYAIRFIIEYLSKHKKSTCEEIAKAEFDNKPTKRLLKSVTDSFRKTGVNNLIKLRLVRMEGFKKIIRRYAQVYSLTPLGILYSIHLFGKLQWKEDHEINLKHIRNLSIEYSDTLPKIFGKFKLFEKILGKDFECILITPFNRMEKPDKPPEIFAPYMLREYVFSVLLQKVDQGPIIESKKIFGVVFNEDSYEISYRYKFLAEQISLVFYTYLLGSMQLFLRNKDKKIIELIKKSNYEFKKNSFDEHLELDKKIRKREEQLRDLAKQKWLKLMNEDKELKKWYNDFVEEVSESKRKEHLELKQYRSATFSSEISYQGLLY